MFVVARQFILCRGLRMRDRWVEKSFLCTVLRLLFGTLTHTLQLVVWPPKLNSLVNWPTQLHPLRVEWKVQPVSIFPLLFCTFFWILLAIQLTYLCCSKWTLWTLVHVHCVALGDHDQQQLPSTYSYDSSSGFYYDSATGLYYDPKTQVIFQYPRWVCKFDSTFYCFSTITIARLDCTAIMIHSNRHTYLLTSMGKNHHPMLGEWCLFVLLIPVHRNAIPASSSSSAPSATTTDTPTTSTTTSKSVCTGTIELLCMSAAFSDLR